MNSAWSQWGYLLQMPSWPSTMLVQRQYHPGKHLVAVQAFEQIHRLAVDQSLSNRQPAKPDLLLSLSKQQE